MYYLSCLFDHRRNPVKPYFAASYNALTKDVQFYQLYQPGTKLPLYEVKENEQKVIDILNKEEVVLSDFHSFISAFDLDVHRQFEVYDVNFPKEQPLGNIALAKKRLLVQISSLVETAQQKWQQILADSQLAYRFLEKTGYYHNGKKCFPTYDLTYTGRSKCLGNNIQGTNAKDTIHHINDEMEVFVHFDWIAADFRVASIISKDKYLKASFKTSDPYTTLFEELNSEEITRDQCKIELFRSLYSMNPDSDTLEFYPGFADWMRESASKIDLEGCSYSLLERCFALEEDRTTRSVFNAQVQGTVAHAMQNVLYRVFKMFPDNILTEVHDSLILCCKQEDLKTIIPEVSNIMLFPFDGILDENYKFPLKISVGLAWKQWQLYKECR
jgi:hypothetical protein